MIYVQSPWLEEIAAGRKTTEGRVGCGKYNDYIGKDVVFHNENLKVACEIVDIIHYDTLESYLNGEGWQNCAPHVSSKEEAVNVYSAITMKRKGYDKLVFSDTRVKKNGGIDAIRIKLI